MNEEENGAIRSLFSWRGFSQNLHKKNTVQPTFKHKFQLRL